jgi:nucleotide-binding universal stress UspA family protein
MTDYSFKNIIVCLDLSSLDELLIKYTAYLAEHMGVERINFVHVIETDDMPREMIEEMFPDLEEPIENVIKRDLEEKVDQNMDRAKSPAQVDLTLKEGNATDTILNLAEQSKADLLLLGKKVGYQGTGILSGKVIRLVHCSVMILPETWRYDIKLILAPVDFSDFSRLALQNALFIAGKFNAEVLCQYVYNLSVRYYPYIPSKKMSESVKKKAREDYKKFIKKLNKKPHDIPCIYTLDNDNQPADKIYDQAIRQQADLVVMGSKGRTNAASYLLGSVAEKLTTYDKSIPLLIIKDKEENLGFLDVLNKFYSNL